MVRDNNIRIRIFKNRLLYVLVCVLSGLTASLCLLFWEKC